MLRFGTLSSPLPLCHMALYTHEIVSLQEHYHIPSVHLTLLNLSPLGEYLNNKTTTIPK